MLEDTEPAMRLVVWAMPAVRHRAERLGNSTRGKNASWHPFNKVKAPRSHITQEPYVWSALDVTQRVASRSRQDAVGQGDVQQYPSTGERWLGQSVRVNQVISETN
jgi:hypothetical protein